MVRFEHIKVCQIGSKWNKCGTFEDAKFTENLSSKVLHRFAHLVHVWPIRGSDLRPKWARLLEPKEINVELLVSFFSPEAKCIEN